MTPEQKAAYVFAQAAAAMIEVEGMKAENRWRESNGQSIAYTVEHFHDLIAKYDLGCNALNMLFRD